MTEKLIDRNPDVLGGTPVFSGTRVPVRILMEHLEAGDRLDDFLNDGDAVDQEYDVVSVMAVVRIDAELIDDLELVLAPVLDVNEGVVERRAVVADERFPVPEGACGFVHVGCDDLIKESLELSVGEVDAVECLELLPEVRFKLGFVADRGAVFVLEVP